MIERQKKIYLCNPMLEKINVLNGLKTDTADYHPHVKDYDELTFEVDKYVEIDGQLVPSNCYDMLDVYMYLYLEDIGHFQMQMPTVVNDGYHESKQIVAYSIEKEFEDKDWKGLEVNTGLDGSYERIVDGNLDELGFAKEHVVLFRPDKPELSLLHIIINEKMPMWSVREEDIDPLSWNKKMSISEDNINCYALLTSVIAPKLDIIFMFDTMNRRIKVIDKDSLNSKKYDTNIYIGLRNLMNSEDFSIDEDSVFTRFYVQGDDTLDIRDYNYNDNRMVNLDYFLNNKYMPDELIEKVKNWLHWRDYNRQDYLNYSKQLADINDKITEITYRVPHDGLETNQYTNMDDELLVENQKYFNAQIEALQVSVDPDAASRVVDGKYVPRKKPNGDVDHDWYLEKLWDKENGYGGYYTYYEIITFILPNIQIAINNKGKVKEEKEDYIKDFEQMWELSGIKELEALEKKYMEAMASLENYALPWSQLTDLEKAEELGGEGAWNVKHDEYAKYVEWLGDENTPDTLRYQLKLLRDEVADLQEEYDNVDEVYRKPLIDMAQIDSEFWGLTTKELYNVYTLLHDTDYQNQNIITTSVDTALTKIDREIELYEDAEGKLSEVSQPQMHYNVTLDNFLHIPEFSGWKDDLDLLNFIRVGIYDNYAVKLRVIGYHYNPCEIDPQLELEFSNFITSKSGRSDLTDIVGNENNRGAKNSISIGTGDSETDRQYMAALLEKMVQTQLFSSAVSGIASGTVAQVDDGKIMNLVTELINASEIHVDRLTGDTAEFGELIAEYISADFIGTEALKAVKANIAEVLTVGTDTITEITGDYISTTTINARQIVGDNGDFQNLTTTVLTVGRDNIVTIAEGAISAAEISADQITSGTIDTDRLNVSDIITVGESGITTITERAISTAEISAEQITTGVLNADRISSSSVVSKLISAEAADFQNLTANSAFIEKLNSGLINATTVTADQIIAGLVDVDNPEDFSLLADTAFIEYLNSELITASEIQVDDLKAKLATIDVADIDTLYADNAFTRSLQSLSSTAATSVINDAYIQNAVAGKMTVGDLAAGDITISDTMRILSENGKMVMNGSALQIMGTDSQGNDYVGVQLGYATNGEPSLVLRNEDGAIIIDPTGITEDAIADQLIKNDMIKNGTISENKLGFNVMKQGDTVAIEQITTGGGSFGVEYTEFKNGTQTALEDLRTDLEESANYDLYIEAPNGTNIWGGNIQLNVKLFKNNVDVTDDFDASCFVWTRSSRDHDADTYWNSNHSNGEKVLTITANDVRMNANFQCKFEYQNITVVAD